MIDWMTALLGSIRENKEKMKSLRRGEVRVLMCVCVYAYMYMHVMYSLVLVQCMHTKPDVYKYVCAYPFVHDVDEY